MPSFIHLYFCWCSKNTNQTNLSPLPFSRVDIHLPSTIATLSYLNFFNMEGNSLRGPIPPGVLALPRLTVFDVSNNQISGSLPIQTFG